MRFGKVLLICALGIGLAGCSGSDVEPADLRDPCPLITDDLLARLAPGAEREAGQSLGSQSGTKECNVDLTAGDGFRGDLTVKVMADSSGSAETQAAQCARIGAPIGPDGPGARPCCRARPGAGS